MGAPQSETREGFDARIRGIRYIMISVMREMGMVIDWGDNADDKPMPRYLVDPDGNNHAYWDNELGWMPILKKSCLPS